VNESPKVCGCCGSLPHEDGRHTCPNCGECSWREYVPPVDENGLRLDGPTLSEWKAGGYKAKAYPPKGYAARPEPSKPEAPAEPEQTELDPEPHEATDAAAASKPEAPAEPDSPPAA
jgi:hypothetical protein